MSSLRVKQSGKVIKEIILDEAKSYLAGRKEGADIFLEAAKAISREHFILKFDQFWTVEVLSRFGDIQFNNDRVRQFTLQEDSVFSIFPYDFEFIKEDPKVIGSPQSSDLGMVPGAYEHQLAVGDADEFEKTSVGGIAFVPHIQFLDENQFMQNLVTLHDQNEWTAGREASNEIVINDNRVSRKQFKITKEGNSYFILDLGSVNGTSLNSKIIVPNEPTPIRSGDRIQVLDTVMMFELKNKDFDNELKKIQEANLHNPENTNLPALHTGMSMAHTQATQNSLVHYTSEQAPLPSLYQNQNQGMAPYDPNAMNYNYEQAPMPEGEFEEYEDTGAADKKKQIRMLLVGAVVLVFIFVGYSEFLAPKKPTKGKVSSSDPYSKLNANELSLMKQSYEIATDYYFKKSYQLAYDETQKIIKKLEEAGIAYKKTKFGIEVDDLSNKASLAIEAEKELMRHAKEIEDKQKQDQIVSTVYNECEKRLNSNPEMTLTEYDECAREAVQLNPEHPQRQSAVLKIQSRIEEKNRKAAEQKFYRERVAKLKAIYARASATEKSGNLLQAIDDYKVVLRQDLPDPEELKDISQRKIASIQKMISTKSSKYVDDGEKFASQKKYKDAIDQFRKAQKVNPLDNSFEDRIAGLKRDLAKEIKPIWDEAVIEEQYNQVECMENKSCAIEKWKKVIEMDVRDGEYYSKAMAKLKKYGAH
ncbi:MAG: FHA domain-containing protein [Bdellovibrionaceae bacterium]|nr:FHA domain-containing protein [Pseudobdellovibrionaceae bacterium]